MKPILILVLVSAFAGTARATAIFIISLFVGCNAGSGSDPPDVIRAFYDAANQGKYEQAKQYLSQEGIRNVEGPLGARAGGFKGIMDRYTGNGTLTQVDVSEVDVRGEGASLRVTKHFRDGSTRELPIEFIKEDGKWKISWSTPTL